MTIGQGIRRADGHSKVTGATLYLDDIQQENCLHGATVRSKVAHARILGVEKDPDFDWTDITVLTAKDIPGENLVYLMTRDQPALADEWIRHVEEPVALVAAPTRERALEAAKHVIVKIEEKDALLDMECAEHSDIRIFGEDNLFKKIEISRGEPELVVGGRMIEGTYTTGHHEQLYIEPQGMMSIPQKEGGLCIVGSMQCPYYIIKGISELLGPGFEDPDQLQIVQAATGGGFGGKEEYPSMLAAHCALLSVATGAPVKIVYRRDEDLRATTKRHPSRTRIRTRVDDDGRLLSVDVDMLVDGGAYNTLTPVVLSRGVLHATGPYRCDHVRILGKAVATHSPPNGAFRGFGAPQAQWASERHMDRIARELGIDPVELRIRNLVEEGDRTATGQRLVSPGGKTVLQAALQAVSDLEDEVRPEHPGGGGVVARRAKGRGLSLVFHGCGFTGNGEARLKGKLAMALEDGKVCIYTGSTEIGQGTDTIFPQIAAEELGIDLGLVYMAPHDTELVPDSGPTVASRTAMVVGGVCQKAAKALRSALQEELGLDAPFASLMAMRESTESLRVEAQYVDDGSLQWDDQTYQGDAYPTYGWSCSIVDLSVDLDTGEVIYERFISATDVGKALNPVLASGQIEGGSLQALGWATSEEVVLNDQGGMENDRLTNYIIPTSLDAPEMHTILVEIPYEGGPFGAKGIGEIPMDGPAAAVAQAIEQATGVVLDELPMTPERILGAMDERGVP